MKTQSSIKPNKFKITRRELLLCENVEETKNEDGDTIFNYDMSLAKTSFQNRDELIGNLVALKYSKDDELALINKGIEDSSNAEYQAYRSFVKECKTQADSYFGV